ncbi:MAG TPA: carbamoylphosphate synthase large subunit short form [Treponema sp.]|nr:carbamoylphosphate synthase large subunit short form [Treponema sp.]
MKKNILIFPCGSEIGLEIHRSVKDSIHFNLIGGSSVDDHGRFLYKNYIGGIPFITDPQCIPELIKIVKEKKIDAIYPAMDLVIAVLKKHEADLGCKIIASPAETTDLCLSKRETYKKLESLIKVPKLYAPSDTLSFPVFVKPNKGYGSRGAKKISSQKELELHLENNNDVLICEYLSGEEYTVDCFTNKDGELLFAEARTRSRIMNGISVHTKPVEKNETFAAIANKINNHISFRGAWFFQLKKNAKGELVLLEIASRLGGSSGLFRVRGINFALLSLYDAFDIPVSILDNAYSIEMDRALDNRYKTSLVFDEVFIDYDDCIYSKEKGFNLDLMRFIFDCKNKGKKISLLSKHQGNLNEELKKQGIHSLFDRIIHILESEKKSAYIDNSNAIFIDDSFAERKEVKESVKIPVFSLDMLPCLL